MPKKPVPFEEITTIRNLAREGLAEREIADRLSIVNSNRVSHIVTGYSYRKIPPSPLTKEEWKRCKEQRNANTSVSKEMPVRK